jgi:hypothetical protein
VAGLHHKAAFLTSTLLITFILRIPAQDTPKTVKQDSLQTASLDSPVYYQATDSIRFLVEKQHIFLYGDGQVEYEGVKLNAEQIEIDYENNLVYAHGLRDSLGNLYGTPVFKSDEEEIACEEIIYNIKTQKGKIKNIITKQGELIIKGEKIKKDSNNVMYFKNLACLPCEFDDAKTLFRATKAKVIPNDKIVTGPMYLEIAGVPTPLALPFGYFPNTKKRGKSGLIIPTYGESPTLGYFLKDGGFYWAINDKVDMQFRGDIYTFGSWAVKTITNYSARYKFSGNLNLGYSTFNIGEKELPDFSKKRDFFVRWTHVQDAKSRPGTNFSATVNAGSNSFNQYNAQSSGQYLTNTFASNISYARVYKMGALFINALHNQNTQTKIIEATLPSVTFNVNRFFPFRNETRTRQNWLDKIGMSYLVETKAFLSRADSLFFNEDSPDQIRYGIHHSLPISTNMNLFKYFTFTPAINIGAWNYMQSLDYNWNSTLNKLETDTISGFKSAFDLSVSGEINTTVYGNYFFKGKGLKQIRHQVIPTIRFTYRPDQTLNELGFYKEVQYDTIGNTRQISRFSNGIYGGPGTGRNGQLYVNLNNNIEAKVRQKTDTGFIMKKIVLLQNLSLNGAYDFIATEFNLSTLGLTGRTRIWKNIDLLFGGVFDPYALNESGTARVNSFQWDNGTRPLRFTAGNLAVNTAFSNSTFTMVKTAPQLTNTVENKSGNPTSAGLPWTINLYYNLVYRHEFVQTSYTQTLNLSGDVAVTKKWKLGFTSGYDFTNKDISYTSLNIYRDLHCWEARFDWVPFGFNKRYSVSLNLKTSMLRDIKPSRTRAWYDNL